MPGPCWDLQKQVNSHPVVREASLGVLIQARSSKGSLLGESAFEAKMQRLAIWLAEVKGGEEGGVTGYLLCLL